MQGLLLGTLKNSIFDWFPEALANLRKGKKTLACCLKTRAFFCFQRGQTKQKTTENFKTLQIIQKIKYTQLVTYSNNKHELVDLLMEKTVWNLGR